jgi:hypothetical protein
MDKETRNPKIRLLEKLAKSAPLIVVDAVLTPLVIGYAFVRLFSAPV